MNEHPRAARQDASRYYASAARMTWQLLADGYTVTWAPGPDGFSLSVGRPGPAGARAAYQGAGQTMQDAWDKVRAQLGHGKPPAASGEAAGSPPAGGRLYRVVQHYDSWPFENDSRVPAGRRSHRRTETFRTLGPVRARLARANGYARYQWQHEGDWSAFVAFAEQLTDAGWQPVEVDFQV